MKGTFQQNLLAGKKVAFYTLGCKLNFAETSTLGKELERWGAVKIAPESEDIPNIAILNTCSVTEMADKKCRSAIRKIHRTYPQCIIVVMGCYAQLNSVEIGQIPGVSIVAGSGHKLEIPQLLQQYLQEFRAQASLYVDPDRKHLHHFEQGCSSDDRTRHFLKVQDGCDYFCSYCTIPMARGRSRNGSIASLVEQAQAVEVDGGAEIVLTGVNIGDFGRTTQERFIDLLKALERETSIPRFRIGSIEPNLLSQEIIEWVASSSRFMPHFHMPLQSGSDRVLALMKRRYDTVLFRQRVNLVRSLIPDAFIGVDIIAGMRGETDELFKESCQFVESLPISHLHVFPYSERPNTKALEIDWVVSRDEKNERVHRLIELSHKKHSEFARSQYGLTRSVLWEKRQDEKGCMLGFTDNYLRVQKPFSETLSGSIESVKIGKEVDKEEHICCVC